MVILSFGDYELSLVVSQIGFRYWWKNELLEAVGKVFSENQTLRFCIVSLHFPNGKQDVSSPTFTIVERGNDIIQKEKLTSEMSFRFEAFTLQDGYDLLLYYEKVDEDIDTLVRKYKLLQGEASKSSLN